MSTDFLRFALEIAAPPPPGSPYSVPLPGTEEPDRSPIYRHWRFKDKELLETIDPKVGGRPSLYCIESANGCLKVHTCHDIFESTGDVYHMNSTVPVLTIYSRPPTERELPRVAAMGSRQERIRSLSMARLWNSSKEEGKSRCRPSRDSQKSWRDS